MSKKEDNKGKEIQKNNRNTESSSRDSEGGETFTVIRGKQEMQKEGIRRGKKREAESSKPKTDLQEIRDDFGKDSSLTVEPMDSSVVSDGYIPQKSKARGRPAEGGFGVSTDASSVEHMNLADQSYCEESPSNQTLTNIESLPPHYIVQPNCKEKVPCNFQQLQHDAQIHSCQITKKKYFGEIHHKCHHFHKKNGQHGMLNRYNKNQVIIQRDHSPKQWFNKAWFGKKKKIKYKNMAKYGEHLDYGNADSGETMPQLYKAKVKGHLSNVPDLFKFRAVNRQEFKTNHARIEKMNFKNDNIVPCQCSKKPSTQFDSTKLKKNTEETNQLIVKNNINDLSNYRAYLNFDGTEYISISELPERIDIYCFDHLNTSYFRTTDQPPPLLTDEAIQKTEDMATRFWAEIFGFFHLFISFFIAFILQLYKFILFSFIRPLLSGLVQLTADYFLKPLLTIIYNGFTQPLMVFIFNVASSLRDICYPIARGIGFFLTEFSVILKAIRLVEWNRLPRYTTVKDTSC